MDTTSLQPAPSFAAGYGEESPATRHWVEREGASNWLMEYSVAGRVRFGGEAEGRVEGAGFAFFFRAGARQRYGMDPAHGHWVHYWAWFTPRAEWLPWLEWPLVDEGVNGMALPAGEARERAASLWRDVLDAYRQPFVPAEELGHNLLLQFFLRCDAHNPRRDYARLDDRVRLAVDRITRDCAEPLTVEDLADAAHLSPSRLAHLFRRETGIAPMRYLERVRLERARDLLLMTRLPVAEVARQVGYDNPFYFSRLFRRFAGKPPRDYRRGMSL